MNTMNINEDKTTWDLSPGAYIDIRGMLHNFSPQTPIQMDEHRFRTAEDFYQAGKFSNDSILQERFLAQANNDVMANTRWSRQALKRGQGLDPITYQGIQAPWMLYVVTLRALQNPRFAQAIQENQVPFVEDKSFAPYWGAVRQPPPNNNQGIGSNVLGQCFQIAGRFLKHEIQEPILAPEEIRILGKQPLPLKPPERLEQKQALRF